MAYADIHAALTQSVIDLALGVPIAHENTPFDPDIDGGDAFIAIDTLDISQESLTKATLDEGVGIYQLSVYTKSNLGKGASLALIDLITDNYKHNTSFTSGAQRVVVINTDVGSGRNDSGWYINDISIQFKTDILR